MYSELQLALKLLNTAGIKVVAAAQNLHADLPANATILLGNIDDKHRAIGVLEKAGMLVLK